MLKQIVNFLRDRPAIRIREIEREAGIPQNTLSNLMSEAVDKRFPDKHVWPLVVALCRYGLEIDTWRLSYDSDIHAIFAECPIPDLDVETVEHELDGGTWIEHRVPMYRQLIDSEWELYDFLDVASE